MATRTQTILAVDESEVVREIYRLLLSPKYTVVSAASGQEAVEKLAQGTGVDLILLDISMSQGDGLAFLKQLRADPRLAWVSILVVSFERDASRALALGANSHITKPFPPAELLRLVERSLTPLSWWSGAPSSFQQPVSGCRRIVFREPCEVLVRQERSRATAYNLSRKGMYVALVGPPLHVGEAVHLTFSLPGDVWDVTCEARVAWVNPSSTSDERGAVAPGLPPGCGLEFAQIAEADVRRIEARVQAWRPERMR